MPQKIAQSPTPWKKKWYLQKKLRMFHNLRNSQAEILRSFMEAGVYLGRK